MNQQKIGELYLSAMLAQLRTEGYSIFVVKGAVFHLSSLPVFSDPDPFCSFLQETFLR
mgnify:CR=1 FL=1